MIKKINWPVFVVLIAYPALLIGLAINYNMNFYLGWFEIILFIAGYYGSNISVGIGFHRLWSHNTYKTNKFVEFILVMISAGTLQGPVLAWASDHHKHHTYTDKEEDPHSPNKFKNPVMGFLWSHIGWMLFGEGNFKQIDRVTMVKLGKNKLLRWQLQYYWQIALFMTIVMPAIVGFVFGGTLIAAYAGFLFIGLGRTLQQQATFCVNSLCHFVGKRTYSKSTAGDIWWMALFLLGENWHNFHHAFPSDYRNGAKWYHFDVHKWIIFLMSKVGLAWNLERTQEFRINAKVNETLSQNVEIRKQRLDSLQSKANQLVEHICTRLAELDNSSESIKNQLKKTFIETQESLKRMVEHLHSHIKLNENSSERLLRSAANNLQMKEQLIYKLCDQYQRHKNIQLT
ncbi:MAG: acyl-CoA desaturase [Janthinobacterium lividum]